MLFFHSLLNVQNANIPLPQVQRVADVQELFLAMKLELVRGFQPRVPAKAVELLPVYPDDVTQIAIPAKNPTEDVVEFGHRRSSEISTIRITIGFTSRSTARKVRRLEQLDSATAQPKQQPDPRY